MNDALVIEVVRKTVTVDCVGRGGVPHLHDGRAELVAGRGPLDPRGREQRSSSSRKSAARSTRCAESGEHGHWATVLEWDPPSRLVLAWEVTPSVMGTEVEVRFLPADAQTRVELEHRGWERVAEHGPDKRESYDTGWEFVLGKYVDCV